MLAVSPLRNTKDENERKGEMENFSMGTEEEFGDDFTDGNNLLDGINFDDIFMGDMLPDLEVMDPAEILPDFSATAAGSGDESEMTSNNSLSVDTTTVNKNLEQQDKATVASSPVSAGSGSNNFGGRSEIVSQRVLRDDVVMKSLPKETGHNNKGRKSSSAQSKNSQGKRKVKVDWTPELHRRFVQAVEQLGVDKAVPSRILEIMGIDCLTRHNIASHLQKYRSHRKHLLAREAEAASWNQKRQMYGVAAAAVAGGGVRKRDISLSPWLAPATLGFPPMTNLHPHFRPLHVWGHPTMDQSLIHIWPKHLAHSPTPPWTPQARPQPPPLDPSYWLPKQAPECLTPGTPIFPQPLTTSVQRFPCPPVPGIPPPPAMYKADPTGISLPAPRPLFDFHPSKESIDAAIGDVLSKPSLPLPLGLKPPALDSVMTELQRQGVQKIPPSCA